ncbi:MAG: glycosyltransferase family 4 protein [Anaerolineales bacterium]|nr:glycosyltransferase family 4 protein [Anaerolineales bacterium]
MENVGGLSMEIGIDATAWQNKRGYGRHARALFGALIDLDRENHYTLFLDTREGWDALPARAARQLVLTEKATAVAAAADGHRSLRDMARVSWAISRAGCDLLIFPTVYSYVPVVSRARKIVLIHDVIAETFPELTLPSPLARRFWQLKVALGRRQADAIVTVSEYSRQGIARHFGLPADQIHVVGEAGDPIFRRLDAPEWPPALRRLGLSAANRSVIYVGGFGPHKNLAMLVDTFARLVTGPRAAELADARLVLVGEYRQEVFHSSAGSLQQQIQALGITDRVIFTGYLPDADLVQLLNLGTVLVLPSLMEGFGLPAVEAAACGCPVIATTESPLPGLLGSGGLYVNPRQPQALEAALARVLSDAGLRQEMGAAGRAAAQALTWPAAARQLLAVIEAVGPGTGRPARAATARPGASR